MIVILKKSCEKEAKAKIIEKIESYGLSVHLSEGEDNTVLGLIGDTRALTDSFLSNYEGVENVVRISTPYKKASRMFHPEDTVINVKGVKIGGNNFTVMAGPCSVESEEQVTEIAKAVKESGAAILRGGAFKPRTSPYAFQGMGIDGLRLLQKASEIIGLPVVTELMSSDNLDIVAKYSDIIQIGARNMQNFELLKAVGRCNKPVLLKRGLSATVQEFLMAAEYIMSEGNENVILCERGIRTFETYTRNTLDISIVPALKRLTHLPVIVDPSHATGKAWMVEPMAKSAVAAGADGIMVEVHNDPKNALCDGEESVTPEEFGVIMNKLKILAEVEGKSL